MKASYIVTEQLYVDASMLARRTYYRVLFLLLVAFIVIAFVPTLLTYTTEEARRATIQAFTTITAGTVGGLAGILIVNLARPWYLRRQYRKYKGVQEPCTIEVLEDALIFTRENGHTRVAWDGIHKWRQGKTAILIYPAPHIFYVIPKTVQADDFPLSILYERLTRYVGKAV